MLITDRRIPALSEQGIPFVSDLFALSPAQVASGNFGPQPTVTNAAGQALRFAPGGGLVPINFGTDIGNLINFAGGNGYSLGPTGNLSTPTERYLANVLASYQLTDGIRAFFEGWYSHTKGTNLVAQPQYNTALFDAAGTPNGNLIIDINNPFLTAASRATIAAALPEGQTNFYLGRANTDLSPGTATGTIDLFRVVAGLDGSFHIGDKSFTWEVVGNFGRSTANGSSPQIVTQNFNNAVDAVLSPTGQISCRPGVVSANIKTRSATCTPINLFGQGSISPAALDYITADATAREVNEQVVATASITGSADPPARRRRRPGARLRAPRRARPLRARPVLFWGPAARRHPQRLWRRLQHRSDQRWLLYQRGLRRAERAGGRPEQQLPFPEGIRAEGGGALCPEQPGGR